MKKIAFIPARSGSKRLPNKNVKMLGHMPLVCWTLSAFLDSQCFDEVIFSSDSEEYWNIVNEYISSEKLKFHLRTERESGDKIKIFDYIKDNIDVLCEEESIFSLGLPTCPFRNSNHVRECFSLFESEKMYDGNLFYQLDLSKNTDKLIEIQNVIYNKEFKRIRA